MHIIDPGVLNARRTLDTVLRRPEWQRDALCREYPTVNFFPGKGERNDAARGVCARCLARDACLAFALEHDDLGIWGGTTAHERDRLRATKVA